MSIRLRISSRRPSSSALLPWCPMLPNPFDSPTDVLAHARDHIKDLERRIGKFFNPYTRVIDVDPNTGESVHKLKFHTGIPVKMSCIAHDAVSNSRDALDHAVYASTVTLRGYNVPAGWSRTKFPVGKTAVNMKGQIDQPGMQHVPTEIKPLLVTFEAHKQGRNHAIWAMNELRNEKTHRVLVPVSPATPVLVSNARIVGGTIGVKQSPPVWHPANHEIELFRTGAGTQVQYNLDVAPFISLSDTDPALKQPAASVLSAISDVVEGIVSDISERTARILRERSV